MSNHKKRKRQDKHSLSFERTTPVKAWESIDSSRIQYWLDVEAALARAQEKLGIIPVEATQEINRKAHWENLNLKEMQEIYEKFGHP